ncbi:UPF0481 protein [Canna indica]|uniref:UPF0481 protein n=1 Tax=Canna indica TaxID=4628 RepID=A0AAQ3Q1C9_9LILI|nr:UPF0481 protein [Canna indica]
MAKPQLKTSLPKMPIIEMLKEMLQRCLPIAEACSSDCSSDCYFFRCSITTKRTPSEILDLLECVEPDSITVEITPSEILDLLECEEQIINLAGRINVSTEDDVKVDLEWIKDVTSQLIDSWPPVFIDNPLTIFRIPSYIRDCDDKTYEPTIVALGLLHFSKGHELSPRLLSHKTQSVSYLLARHGRKDKARNLLDECRQLMLILEPEARSRNSEDHKSVDKLKFAKMLLRDGCFILYLLLKQENAESQGTEESKEDPILFDLLKTPADDGIDLVQLAIKLLSRGHPGKDKAFNPVPSSQSFHHLLHIFHSSLTPSRYKKMPLDREEELPTSDWIPNATVLQEAGIQFKRKKAAKSFLEVTYRDGVMEIPFLQVDDSTTSFFRNLIAFEQCYQTWRTDISVYAAFMKCMINTPYDVRLLSLNKIVLNMLGNEQDVVDLFDKLCHQIQYDSKRNYLQNVFIDVTSSRSAFFVISPITRRWVAVPKPRARSQLSVLAFDTAQSSEFKFVSFAGWLARGAEVQVKEIFQKG